MEIVVNQEYWVLRTPSWKHNGTFKYLSTSGEQYDVPSTRLATFCSKKEAEDYIPMLRHVYGVKIDVEAVKVTEQYKITKR